MLKKLVCVKNHVSMIHLRFKSDIWWNSVITNSVVNEHSVIKNTFSGQFCYFNTQINPVLTKPGYNEQK
jgi:hypothetical protein